MVHIEMQDRKPNVDENNGFPQTQRYVAAEKGFHKTTDTNNTGSPFWKEKKKTGCKINKKMKRDRDRYAAVCLYKQM